MNVSREDAEKALADIDATRGKVTRVQSYGDAAPYFILWGVIWLIANVVTEFAPERSGLAWLIGIAFGGPATLILSLRQTRRRAERGGQPGLSAETGRRIGISNAVVIAFFVAMFFVIGPLDPRQTNAFISLFWAFAYMAAGVWIGWRLFAIGAATAAAILFFYLALEQYYFLSMGLVAGGGLIAGGVWLRKV